MTENRHDEYVGSEMDRARARIHNLADKVQGHEIFLENHRVSLQRNQEEINEVRRTLLQSISDLRATSATKQELVNATQMIDLKLASIEKTVNASSESITWAVRVVLGIVIAAVVAAAFAVKTGAIG